ncbi:MAG TPA: DUF4214 domain-containing protein [Acidimicrobiales bacterium]|jgi:2-polyprenyl-3-methyl-5-hydroxy-6-metoxy-1,4-benzoquinol methylase|nr:DUF4214 domain-containing protein [Acidimicrobiales bacterium]
MADRTDGGFLGDARRAGRRALLHTRNRLRPTPPDPAAWHAGLSDRAFVDMAYQRILQRPVDEGGRASWLQQLSDGRTRAEVEALLEHSTEAVDGARARAALEAFHSGRVTWMRSLPPAKRILDLGGTALGSDHGALQVMGYPYDFAELTIIELPVDARHELYQVPEMKSVDSPHGPVHYRYQSMTELSNLADGSYDLICSGQTFEHITAEEGRGLLHDVRRLLAPGGFLALDTPNRAITEIECRQTGLPFINPDHKIEYTHSQMLERFAEAGLEVVRSHGIGYMPTTATTGAFVRDELIEHPTLYADIERCYTLAYLVQAKPATQ